MKLHFEPKLDYQVDAIEAVCDLFHGQEVCRTEFTVTREGLAQRSLAFAQSDLGIGNRLMLIDEELCKNLHAVQLRHGLPPSEGLDLDDLNFTVEMETGTGKTYVYLRTIFELNKRYGFTKFVIVVPSVAIKEGVYKTLQITEDHFRALYAGAPYEYFLYNSSKLGEVRNFATSPTIQIMVVTVGAINKKDVNNLYQDTEKTGGEKPIDLIRATHPIVIVDEPQSVDGGLEGKGKAALSAMKPLCTLRYSATHADTHHMVYRLDAVDAYQRGLVKQIEVASAAIEGGHNKPYVRVLEVSSKRGLVTAKVEIDFQEKSAVRRVERIVRDGDDLQEATGREVYRDCRIGEIRATRGNEFVELRAPGQEPVFLRKGDSFGGPEPLAVEREMIRRTIREHLEKEKRLRPLGIKVLSLFFIDAVERYRAYDPDGSQAKGVYATIFEEEYRRWAKHPDYRTLFGEVDLIHNAELVHDGYFSIDKKGRWTDTEEGNQGSRDNAERAYNLIMRDKERLLSFDTPLKFIFSHSALREGWDNPNVFQICSFRDMGATAQRRQTIGRGLRLCVNQNGERIRGFDVNTLTVIATESYEQFAAGLQHEIEQTAQIKFGVVEEHDFAGVAVADAAGGMAPIGAGQSKAVWEALRASGYVDAGGKIQDSLRQALKDGAVALPPAFAASHPQIVAILRKIAGRLDVKNADERRIAKTRQAVLNGPEFKELWDRIKHKTTYRVKFDNEALIQACSEAIRHAPPVQKTRLQWRIADVKIDKAGVEAVETSSSAPVVLDERDIELPDLLSELQDRTSLTRRSVFRIVTESGRLDDFKRNPQEFIDLTATAINRAKRHAIVDGIKYQRLGGGEYYAQELFETEELTGYLKSMLPSSRSVYDHVLYQSETERTFAEDLERNEAVKVYAKLPGWFQVPTPLGGYNPDWAVLLEIDGAERLYFVVETKSSLFGPDRREAENDKILCGAAHFAELGRFNRPAAEFVEASNLSGLLAHSASSQPADC